MNLRQGIPRHPLAIAGVIIGATSATVFIALVLASLLGLFDGPYSGLILFVALPVMFTLGVALVVLGTWRHRLARGSGAEEDWPVWDFRVLRTRRLALLWSMFIALNIVTILVVGYGGLHAMETPGFCGQVCHTPMHPQFTAWQAGTHATVACASCHVGSGAQGFLHAKLAGTRQLAHVITNAYPRPVPAGSGADSPVGGVPCATCHDVNRVRGNVVRVIREYADDEANTETVTTLLMHLGRGGSSGRAIHWHADPSVRVEYAAADEGRQKIPYVKVTDASGRVTEYEDTDAGGGSVDRSHLRVMTCADCHNSIGHGMAATPEQAVDRAIGARQIDRALPFIRREAVRVLKATYPSADDADRGIEDDLRRTYQKQAPNGDQEIARTIAAIRALYRRNVFDTMKVTWGTYPDNSSHIIAPGCNRCHGGTTKSKDGKVISDDCEYCHTEIPTPELPK